MSTRSLIAKKIGEDKYLTIYCHSDGYLTYNGALLLDHYNTPEQVNKLLALGDISYLAKRLEPDPSLPHSFDYDERQEGVTLAYGRDRGEKGTQAREATLADLDDESNWTEYVYIYDENGKWKYFKAGESKNGLRDVQVDLDNEYLQYGMKRTEGYYGFLSDDIIKHLKAEQELNEDIDFDFTDEDYTDIEVMCAKHTLYLHDAGGEKLDLSEKKLLNIDFSNKDICGADLSDAVFVNCNFENTSLCSSDERKAEFKHCNLNGLTAEESDFAESKFLDCNLSNAYFTHSNFRDAEIIDSNVKRTNFSSCCMEGVDNDGTDLFAAVTNNCSYDESEWLDETNEDESPTQSM